MTSTQGYNYNISVLSDLLTKREYLLREYLRLSGVSVILPKYLRAVPNNDLLVEVRKGYSFSDINLENCEGREHHETLLTNNLPEEATDHEKSLWFIEETRNSYHKLINLNETSLNSEIFKNQYRPMKKGVTNMIRLHTTGAIALPVEVRLHILASSKDVIHS